MTLIRVQPTTKERLTKLGTMLETFDDVISRLLAEHEHCQATHTPRRRGTRHEEKAAYSSKEQPGEI